MRTEILPVNVPPVGLVSCKCPGDGSPGVFSAFLFHGGAFQAAQGWPRLRSSPLQGENTGMVAPLPPPGHWEKNPNPRPGYAPLPAP